jgi:hypothetical protein
MFLFLPDESRTRSFARNAVTALKRHWNQEEITGGTGVGGPEQQRSAVAVVAA